MLLINGQETQIDINRYTSFHGNSFFTTLRSKNKNPLLWAAHWHRLRQHALYFSYALPEEKYLYNLIADALSKSEADQKIRVVINSYGDFALSFETYNRPDSSLYGGVSVLYSQEKLHPDFKYYKTGNSLPYQRALVEAERSGAFESLLLDEEGHVVDGSRTSLLFFDGETLFSLEGGLRGIMREEIISVAKKQGVIIKRKLLKRDGLTNGQIMLSNCLYGLLPVGSIKYPLIDSLVNYFRMDF